MKCPEGTMSVQDIAPLAVSEFDAYYVDTFSKLWEVRAVYDFLTETVHVSKAVDMFVLFKNSVLGILIEFQAGCTNGSVTLMDQESTIKLLELMGKTL